MSTTKDTTSFSKVGTYNVEITKLGAESGDLSIQVNKDNSVTLIYETNLFTYSKKHNLTWNFSGTNPTQYTAYNVNINEDVFINITYIISGKNFSVEAQSSSASETVLTTTRVDTVKCSSSIMGKGIAGFLLFLSLIGLISITVYLFYKRSIGSN